MSKPILHDPGWLTLTTLMHNSLSQLEPFPEFLILHLNRALISHLPVTSWKMMQKPYMSLHSAFPHLVFLLWKSNHVNEYNESIPQLMSAWLKLLYFRVVIRLLYKNALATPTSCSRLSEHLHSLNIFGTTFFQVSFNSYLHL